jgi:pimeloyl-ACP methyl ester carboxylesterase
VCVHGSLSWGTFAFREQRPLARTRTLLLPDRRGYGSSPPTGHADFEHDAVDVAALLESPGDLVGHSYGAVVALLVAAIRPDAVRTLTLVEPAAFALARGDPAVEKLIGALVDLHTEAPGLPAAEFVLRYLEALGYRRGADLPAHLTLTARSVRAARATMTERPPWEAQIALDALADAHRPTLVVSGRWDNLAAGEDALGRRAFGAVSDVLARALDAQRVIIDGWAHACQYAGRPFNDVLQVFWDSAHRPASPAREDAGAG